MHGFDEPIAVLSGNLPTYTLTPVLIAVLEVAATIVHALWLRLKRVSAACEGMALEESRTR
jgi:hypothetical protein